MNKNKQALFHSVVAMLLCISMLIGATFAWFTDSVVSTANVISTGTLKVGLYHTNAAVTSETEVTNETKNLFQVELWEPGVATWENFTVKNEGSLWLKYQLGLNALDVNYVEKSGVRYYLAEVLKAGVVPGGVMDSNADGTITREEAIGQVTDWVALNDVMEKGDLAPEGEPDSTIAYGVVIRWEPGANDNNLNVNNGSTTSDGNPLTVDLGVTLAATQQSREEDSFGPDYDTPAEFPELELPVKVTVTVPNDGSVTTENVTMVGRAVTATVPAGVKLQSGKEALTLTVTEKESSQANITTGATEDLVSLDVHIDGVDAANDKAIIVDLGPVMPKYLNIGNYRLYHVENGATTQMTAVATLAEVDTHNEFYYDLNTGNLTVAMATFSEVALVADTENKWNGEFDYSWYTEGASPYAIANADQLAAFGAIVGGMNGQTQNSFAGKTVKLIADINLGDDEKNNNTNIIFYPIGYYNSNKNYEKVSGGSVTSSVNSFEGTFDGQGHTVANFYQNTWEMFGDYNNGYTGTPNHYKDAMGLFGYVKGGTVKNLTVDNFSSDGEFTPTGVIAAYADGDSKFENIAITNCNPRVYNTGNGGIIGIAGSTSADDDSDITLTNITVDNSNKISALWGSWDVACGGLVGMYRGNVDANGNATGDTIAFDNCHVSAIIDVYNDVCANYQYYAYRYAGMMIGSVRHNTKNADGKTIPNMAGISATGCTVNYGDWNDYYYCEFEKNTMASYSEDYQFSRVPHSELNFTDSNGNGVVDADERASVTGCKHTHTAEENHQAVYLPFHQLFTGYSWGVSSIGLKEYSGITIENFEDIKDGITEGDQEESVVKFETKFKGDFLYRVGNQNTVALGSLFAAVKDAKISSSGVVASIVKVDEDVPVSGTFTKNESDWTKGTIQFSGTGLVDVTIQDYNFCKPTTLRLEVVDAVNATTATNATANNVVLLNDIGSGFTVSGRYAVYGNGFTLNYTGNGQYLNNGLKQGVVTVSENGTLDNLRIEASIYPIPYMYYGYTSLGDYVQGGPSTVDGDKTRYHYQLSAVAASGNATVSNCYIYGARTNIFINEGNVKVKNSILECGTVANVQIQSSNSYTVTFENVTTIQHQVKPTVGETSNVMLGAGIVVGPETASNPTIVLDGSFKQYNWVNADDANAVSNSYAKMIINTALGKTEFNHTVNGKTASNLGIIYLNNNEATVTNNTGLPYDFADISLGGENGKVYSLSNANADQIYGDHSTADKETENGGYLPQFKYSEDLGGQLIEKTDDGDEFCYREGDTIKVMFPSGDTKELDLSKLASVERYTGEDLGLKITCKDENGEPVSVTDGKIALSAAGDYVVTYQVEGGYSWNVTISVSLKVTAVPNAYFEFDSSKQVIYRSGNSNIVQFIPFLAGLKIYDFYGQNPYLRFDGDKDFNKIAKASIENKNTTGEAQGYHIVTVELVDGGKLVVDMDVRANSGSSTHSGSIKVRENVLYVVNGGTTSGKGQTWKIYSYKFVGNNGTEINSGLVTFGTAGVDCSTATKPNSNFGTTVKYTVTYNANGGDCGQPVGYATSASAAVTLPAPSRSGYICAGWYTAAEGGTRVGGIGDAYTPTANVTLYAHWGTPCKVTYDANGGSVSPTTATYSGDALILPKPTRAGMECEGWYTAAEGGSKVGNVGESYRPDADITLYAQWCVPYTVTYNANEGTCSTSSDIYLKDALTLPTPTRTGYTFNGWYTAATGGTKIGNAGVTYTPSANITLYAQWQINSYTITVTTSNATVKVNGTAVSNNGTVSIQYGAQVTVEVTYSENDSQSTTITGTDGTTYTSPFNMPAQNVTINATSSGCVTPDTLITLADGKQVRVDSLKGNEQLMVWNMETGKLDSAPILFVDSETEAEYEVIHLYFSDGTDVKVISEHGFWDYDLNRYVYLDRYADKYIGHTFAKQNGKALKAVKLTDVVLETEKTTAWSPVTAGHLCYFVNGMLSMPGGVGGLFNIFDVDAETMTYDFAAMAKDIETYGLFTYEELNAIAPLSEDMFNAAGGAYLKISIGKGNLTMDELTYMIGRYSRYFG